MKKFTRNPESLFNRVFLVFTFCTLMLSNISFASHLVGGEITYQWVSGNTYTVRLTLYRDCGGITAPTGATVQFASAAGGFNGFVPLVSTGPGIPVTPICASSLSQSSCNGGALYAVQKYTYEGTVTLPGFQSDWIFSWSECCRNAAISNLATPGALSMYLSALLNNLDTPFNNSVQFAADPVNVIYNNNTTNLSWSAYDVDGDSIQYELTPSRTSATTNVGYNPGYTYFDPFAASAPASLSSTGILTVSPNMTQISVVTMKISEFRMGFKIGEVSRDIQIAVVNSTNSLPELTGMNGTSSFVTNGCPGDTIRFDVLSSDADPGQVLSLSMGSNSTSAVLNSAGIPLPVGTFEWILATTDISSQPYTFTVKVDDDNCDYYGTQTYAYQVYVNGCTTFDVWPGDANSDGTANLYDLLAVGLAFNETGPVRPNASMAWISQPCPDWNNNFISGINQKHADTDGSGTVNIDDTTAIFTNYGMIHPLRTGSTSALNVADLTVTASSDTVGLMATVMFDIALSTPVDSLYGLAFRLYFDPTLTDVSTINVTYPGSIFGTNGVDMIKMDKSIGTTGYVDIALSRIDQQNINGSGPVARVTIVTTDNVSGKISFFVEPFDVVALTASEDDVTLNSFGDEVWIDPNFVGINENQIELQLTLSPVPANDILNFTYAGSETVHAVSFTDVNGKVVMNVKQPSNKMVIDLNALSKGVYFMKSVIGDSTIIKKIVRI